MNSSATAAPAFKSAPSNEIICPRCAARLAPLDPALGPIARVRCNSCAALVEVQVLAATPAHPAPPLPPLAHPSGAAPGPAARPPPRLAPPAIAATWEVRREGYEGATLDLRELRGLVRTGEITPSDEIRVTSTGEWCPASAIPALETALALQRKRAGERLAALARKRSHRCARHRARAKLVCVTCVHPLCQECTRLDGGERLCLECGQPVRAI